MAKKKIKKGSLVVQSNSLIEASYKLTLREKRLILILTSKVEKNDEDFKKYDFSVSELAALFEIKDDSYYTQVQKITKELMSKVLIIKEDKGLLFINWLSSAKYEVGNVSLEFSPRLKPYLLSLKKQFTSYTLKNIVQFKSVYSIRIYELLKQYVNTEQKERTIEVEDLRNKLGITEYNQQGKIIKKKLKNYADLKRKVILQAQKELINKADIAFFFEEIKKGRKVVAIKFLIYLTDKKEKTLLPLSFPETLINNQYDHNKFTVDNMVNKILTITNDEKSKKFFYKVAWEFILNNKKEELHRAISELKADCAHVENKGAAFTTIIKRMAKEANIII